MLILKTLFFTLIAPGTLTVLFPYLILQSRLTLLPNTWSVIAVIGALIILLGLAIYLSCAREFIATGKGTPAPYDPPKFLVAEGLYKITRNPMYIGVTSIIIGEAIFFRSPGLLLYAIVVWTGFHLRVLFYEEPELKRLFGISFDEYCQRVPRWFSVASFIKKIGAP